MYYILAFLQQPMISIILLKTELAKNTESREITNLIIQENEQNEKE